MTTSIAQMIESKSPARYEYDRKRAQGTADRLWAHAEGGKIPRWKVAKIIRHRGETLARRLEKLAAYDIDLPAITDERKPHDGYYRPSPKAAETVKKASLDNLDPDACLSLAAAVLHTVVDDIKTGRDVDQAVRFLNTPRGALFLDELDIDRAAMLEALGVC